MAAEREQAGFGERCGGDRRKESGNTAPPQPACRVSGEIARVGGWVVDTAFRGLYNCSVSVFVSLTGCGRDR